MVNMILDQSMYEHYAKALLQAERALAALELAKADLESIERVTFADIPELQEALEQMLLIKVRIKVEIRTFESKRDGAEPKVVPGRSL